MILYFISLSLFPISYKKLKKEIKSIIWALKFLEKPLNKNQLINKPDIVKKKIKRKTKNNDGFKISIKIKSGKQKRKLKKILNNEQHSSCRLNLIKNIDDKEIKRLNNILKKKSFELNSLDYNEGIKLDQRNYCEYYVSLLKYNHPILFSFAPYNDYNSKTIKFFLFFSLSV